MPTPCFKFANIEKATGVYLPKQIHKLLVKLVDIHKLCPRDDR